MMCDLCRPSMTYWVSSCYYNVLLFMGDSNGKIDSMRERYQIKSWLSIYCRIKVICVIVIIELSNM